MLTRLTRLGLEVESIPTAAAFYEGRLGLAARGTGEGARAYPVGDADLVLREPGGTPRGGLHVHYAFTAADGSLDAWRDRLADHTAEEVDFGSFRSLYAFDPDRHCVEVAATPGDAAAALESVFEVVLEVRDLDRGEATYRALGFEPIDRGDERRRVRLRGPADVGLELELWEPQSGLAGARGGVHVDLAFAAPDPAAAAAAVDPAERVPVDGGVRVYDRDGHALSFLSDDHA